MAFDVLQTTVKITGLNPVAEYLRSEFSRMPQSSNPPDAIIEVEPGFTSPPDVGATTNGNVYVSDGVVFIDRRISVPIRSPKDLVHNYVGTLGRQIQVVPFEDELRVTIRYDPRITARNVVVREGLRCVSRSYVYRSQNLAKVILYNDIEPLLHQLLLDIDAAFIHASGITSDQGTIVFSGWGGAGKTSVATQLLETGSRKLIADDLCLVCTDGTAQPYHKRVQVYPYNLDENGTKRTMAGRSLPDQINWTLRRSLFGESGVRRRLLPDRLHPVSDKPRLDISALVYLTRENRQEIIHKRATIENVTSRAVSTIAHEFDTHVQTLRALCAAEPDVWPSIVSYLSSTRNVYEQAFSDTDRMLVRIPRETEPAELAEYIEKNVLDGV